jgi:hypothetical protein
MSGLQDLIKPLLKKPCWRVRWDNQLNLDLSFGRPSLHIREPHGSSARSPRVRAQAARRLVTVRAEYWLWIYVAYWKLLPLRGSATTQSSSARAKDIACAQLEGQKLVDVKISPRTGSTCFAFDLGTTLEVRRQRAGEDADIWTLYRPRGLALSVRGDGSYSHGRASDREPKWHAIPEPRAT